MHRSPHQGPQQIIEQPIIKIYELLRKVILTLEQDEAYTRLLLTTIEHEARQEKASTHSLSALPLYTCQAAGGEITDAIPVAAAWRALHLAAKFLDDVEDGDMVILGDQTISPPLAINLGAGFIAIANITLMNWMEHSAQGEDIRTILGAEANHAILRMAAGQHVDIDHATELDLEAYRHVMAAKSGSFFLLGAWAGARCATDDNDSLSLYEAFGYNLGMMLQLNDDLKDFRQTGKCGDIASKHYTFPIFYALSVASPVEKKRLQTLLERAVTDIDAELEAKSLVRTLGGEVYLLAETMRYRRRAMKVLANMDTQEEKREALTRYLTWLSLTEH